MLAIRQGIFLHPSRYAFGAQPPSPGKISQTEALGSCIDTIVVSPVHLTNSMVYAELAKGNDIRRYFDDEQLLFRCKRFEDLLTWVFTILDNVQNVEIRSENPWRTGTWTSLPYGIQHILRITGVKLGAAAWRSVPY